ncbi:general stress protein [Cohnella sp. REN36]|uniref:general stress protein n=1 Tax=Cohnella sp. REN36 TaxID=2887347 RepID=UPI001D15B26A|nr:general stress protein [Cohnella sp. REN36]MCC3375778.1 general stress protein [Cohnella sp. REN36]
MKAYAKLVNNGLEAFDAVKDLHRQGYREEEIYVLAHGEGRTDRIADVSHANTIGASEEGVLQSVANLFRDRGDELRSKIRAMGFEDGEAEMYESELDRGKVLVLAKH